MTGKEAAAGLRRLATVIERFEHIPSPNDGGFKLNEEAQLGAAALLSYIKSLTTLGNKEIFTRDELLVVYDLIQQDKEIFPVDLVGLMEAEDNE